ncbi:hypothetical protein ISN44_Un118g000060 [Arabidopsis suecica]|uniref:Uncharacterized protein n=1 Tax=Arabidopsis suecica TaxID=45249 RepID=A0A8T1XG91_ARASU|nr:hypothetical protein ISN44_Un118g000060 [Arabidopsis suecica]
MVKKERHKVVGVREEDVKRMLSDSSCLTSMSHCINNSELSSPAIHPPPSRWEWCCFTWPCVALLSLFRILL